MTVKVDPPYKHLVQKKAFCGPTCIQMILFRRGIWTDQEELAYRMGVKIYEEQKDFYEHQFPVVEKGSPEYGMAIKDFESKEVLNVFKDFGLTAEVFLIREIDDVKEFIIEKIEDGCDVMTCFRFDPIDGREIGHYALVSEFDEKSDTVTLCDPYFECKRFWDVKLEKLKEAMSPKWDEIERGFVVVREK